MSDDIVSTKFYRLQYVPRIRFLEGVLANNPRELKKFRGQSIARKIVRTTDDEVEAREECLDHNRNKSSPYFLEWTRDRAVFR